MQTKRESLRPLQHYRKRSANTQTIFATLVRAKFSHFFEQKSFYSPFRAKHTQSVCVQKLRYHQKLLKYGSEKGGKPPFLEFGAKFGAEGFLLTQVAQPW
jgi:hypothetical protein